MKHYKLILLISIAPNLLFSQTGPGGVGTNDGTSSLDIWLRGDAGVEEAIGDPAEDLDNVTFWRDQSGNGNDAQQTNVADKPNLDTTGMGGRPAINFQSSNTEFLTNSYTFNEDFQVFVVASSAGTNWNNNGFLASARLANGLIVHPSSGTANVTYYSVNSSGVFSSLGTVTPSAITAPNIYNQSVDHTSGSINYDIGYNGSSTTGTIASHTRSTSTQNIYIGRDNCCVGRYLNGKIAEIIFYNAVINDAQKIVVDSYLSAKYGITLSTNDIYDEDDAGAGNYDFDVAGIGRVDASNIHNDAQGTGIIRILNPTGLGNDEFLIWGHDNGTLQATEATDIPAGIQARFDREWRASEVNSSSTAVDVGSIDIRFDLTGLGAVTVSDLRLLVDTDNDGVFNDETPITGATALGGNVYQFAGVTAIANNLRFTLGTINTTQTTLPIELVYFKAKLIEDNQVRLDWQTASEINNDYFTIERSINGTDWQELTRIDGAGNSSSLLSYFSTDKSPYSDISYYRLKQTDFIGEFGYSQIRSIKIDQLHNSKVEIYPNPTTNEINLIGDLQELEQISILNTLGQDVTVFISITKAEEGMIVLDLSNLINGIYYVKTRTTANKVYKQ